MTAVTKSPGTAADDSSFGTISWTNPGNVTVSDNTYATAVYAGSAFSHWLNVTNFGFSIPSDARIDGIAVNVENSETAGVIIDASVQLLNMVSGTSDNKASGNELPAADAVTVYGGVNDLWGCAWTPAAISSSSFGVRYRGRKSTGGAGTAQIDYISITVYYTRPTDTQVTVVRFRRPEPPHDVLLESFIAGMRYGFAVRRDGKASFMLPRSDPNATKFAYLMTQSDRPPMVTIERPDGYIPWVGFVDEIREPFGDPFITYFLQDHTLRLRNARIRKGGVATTTQGSGDLITNILKECNGRGAPPLYLDLDNITAGPGVQYTPSASYAYDFLEDMAKLTDWEWGFAYEVDEKHVKTFLTWTDRVGQDRSGEDIWEEAKHFTKVSRNLKYSYQYDAATVVGGTGTFNDRPAAEVSRSGLTSDGIDLTGKKSGARSPGLGGTYVEVIPQTTDASVLRTSALRIHTDLRRVPEQLSFSLHENQVDMSRFGVGDYRTIRLQTTDLGSAVQRTVRIIGIEMQPDTKEISCETQVIPS